MGYMKNKKLKRKGPPFVMIYKETLRSKEWKELSSSAKVIYIYIKSKYNGSNNGELSFKYLEYKNEFSSGTISNALKQLVKKEWLNKTKHGGMYRYYCLYELTGKHDKIL